MSKTLWCGLCGFEMTRNLCTQCIETMEEEMGMDRDTAEEAYLAMAPEPEEDEEDEEDEDEEIDDDAEWDETWEQEREDV